MVHIKASPTPQETTRGCGDKVLPGKKAFVCGASHISLVWGPHGLTPVGSAFRAQRTFGVGHTEMQRHAPPSGTLPGREGGNGADRKMQQGKTVASTRFARGAIGITEERPELRIKKDFQSLPDRQGRRRSRQRYVIHQCFSTGAMLLPQGTSIWLYLDTFLS